MRLGLVVAITLFSSLGCGSHIETDDESGLPRDTIGAGGLPTGQTTAAPPCAKFQERIDGLCRRVTVRDVDEHSVSFESGGYELPGTLSLPVTDGEYLPLGAIIVHGNGPGPRDGTASQNLGFAYPEPVDTYANLAQTLARAGFAVLRYDKRSCFHETIHACKNSVFDYPGDPDAIVLDDFVADAKTAAQYLADRPEVRDRGIVALGHSEGGVLVTSLFDETSPIGAAVLLGAPALTFEDTAAGQLELYADHLESESDAYASEVEVLRDKAARWRDELEQIRQGTYPEDSWEGASLAYVQSTLGWYDSIDERFAAVDQPVLALGGGADFNVGPAHLEHYRSLAEQQKPNVSIHSLPDVTHAFCVKPSSAWATFEPTLAPEAEQRLLSWLGADEPALTF